jgi:predicted transcriptional regulator
LRREEVLAYEARRRVYQLIQREPGLHLRELERRSAMPLGTLRHHLRFLELHKLVEAQDDKNVVRYFAVELVEPSERATIAALRQEALRRVLLFLLARGGSASYRDLLDGMGTPASTLAVYLSQLSKAGIVERVALGRESRYDVREPERIVRLLHTYRASFVDALVDHLLDVVYQDEP